MIFGIVLTNVVWGIACLCVSLKGTAEAGHTVKVEVAETERVEAETVEVPKAVVAVTAKVADAKT